MITSLRRLEETLRTRPGLRLRFCCASQEFSSDEMRHGHGRWFSGVRGLWEILALPREPDLALVMMQAPAVPPEVPDYLLKLSAADAVHLPDCRARLAMVHLNDRSERHLSEKFLAAPQVLAQLRHTVLLARARGHVVEGLSCFSSSERMASLAETLGLTLLETQPDTLHWGGKAGSRTLFRRAGVPHPAGTYQPVHRMAELTTVLSDAARQHGAGSWLVKIDQGFGSGHGNAVVAVADPDPAAVATAVRRSLLPMSTAVSTAEFLQHIEDRGAVVEQFVTPPVGGQWRAPSVSLCLDPFAGDGPLPAFTIQGTHDQILNREMAFAGAIQPASDLYRHEVVRQAALVARELGAVGVRGNVGIDFLAVSSEAGRQPWQVWALEVNLRSTGTTHANRTATLLTGATCQDGTLVAPDGGDVWYLTSDGIMADAYRGITPAALISALLAAPDVRFDPARRSGVVPHLWTTLEPFGKVGAVAIAAAPGECHELLGRFEQLLDRLAHMPR